ncbi:MAG: hypothetical protein FRX48_03052 [Lasallia pustulata]|uniref:Uncharacterized protein n=1 Tax=Lasallia pustulata TaxID=136370 RepID=A0A5M8PUJ8_9LECA|nr:MAG: hypothetical protein FRX48_03052 [Lasallia pustulata]
MPGVPPDALAQVKKGLKGLFNRKKKSTTQQTPQPAATHTKPTTSTPASSSGTPTTTHSHPHPPPPPPPPSHHQHRTPHDLLPPPPLLPLPSQPDLSARHPNPSHHTPLPPPKPPSCPLHHNPHAAATPTKPASAAATSTGAVGTNMAAPGMSATSGPLEDQLAHGYVDEGEGTPFATPMEGPPRGLGTA